MSSSDPLVTYEAADVLLGCVCSRMVELKDLVEDYPGCPCWAYVSPATPAFDSCCEDCPGGEGGQLTVHLEDLFPSESFPTKTPLVFPCAPASYVGVYVVTVARCAPSMDEQGRPPPMEVMDRAARTIMVDQLAVYDAVSCCLPDLPPPGKKRRRAAIQSLRLIGESGGCNAFEVRVAMDLGVVCRCPPEGS